MPTYAPTNGSANGPNSGGWKDSRANPRNWSTGARIVAGVAAVMFIGPVVSSAVFTSCMASQMDNIKVPPIQVPSMPGYPGQVPGQPPHSYSPAPPGSPNPAPSDQLSQLCNDPGTIAVRRQLHDMARQFGTTPFDPYESQCGPFDPSSIPGATPSARSSTVVVIPGIPTTG